MTLSITIIIIIVTSIVSFLALNNQDVLDKLSSSFIHLPFLKEKSGTGFSAAA
ncbi:MAG: hypothetical protein WDM90_09490 [Ferruginibacter sp.]